MVKKHIDELEEKRETVCVSPFLRKLIYADLESRSIVFKTEVVGYGKVVRSIRKNWSRFDYEANPKLILHNLNKHRYSKDVIYEDWHTSKPTNVAELSKLFDDTVPQAVKYDILVRFQREELGGKHKSHIFDHPRKVIKKISIE